MAQQYSIGEQRANGRRSVAVSCPGPLLVSPRAGPAIPAAVEANDRPGGGPCPGEMAETSGGDDCRRKCRGYPAAKKRSALCGRPSKKPGCNHPHSTTGPERL